MLTGATRSQLELPPLWDGRAAARIGDVITRGGDAAAGSVIWRRRLVDALAALEAWGSARDWRGSDPYDGLNATRLTSPLVRSRRGRQILTQAVKRSPLDLRPLLGIRPAHSAAALAQVVSAYARYRFLPTEEAPSKLADAISELEGLRSTEFAEPCWGYHFDVQTRVFFYPKAAPNTIATSFAGLALLDAFETTQERRLLELAEGAGDFFMRHIPPTEAEHGAYFGYLARDRTPIHNANLLVCALLCKARAASRPRRFPRSRSRRGRLQRQPPATGRVVAIR